MTLNSNIADKLPLNLPYVIRNAGRREGFRREVWSQEIDTLLQRGVITVTRTTDTHLFIRFV